MNTLIINADDLGFTESINLAIKEAHLHGYLTHASLMANTVYFQHAVDEVLPACPQLNIGVHVNLTCSKTLTGKSEIAPDGCFRGSFVSWLFMKKNKRILNLIEQEIEAQIVKVKSVSPNISHIDGHEHIHIIPSINSIVRKLADKYKIPRVREINENFFESFKYNFKTTPMVNVVKLGLLKFLSLFNRNSGNEIFYSILNTCQIDEKNLFPYLDQLKGETVEVMLHPSLGFSEKDTKDLDERFITFFKSTYRKQEYDLCFNPQFKKYERKD
ncbi:MAG: ChbG/HpnK family deacetylase [Bacteroidetes bacterium]|nr:ChbG/HpnK family deacetylase [Bacteroidota bacterium]